MDIPLNKQDVILATYAIYSIKYPTINLDKANELSKLCLKDYGNGRWNHASLAMAGFIKDQFDARAEREVMKTKISNALSLLSSMVSCGEFHTDVSSDTVKLAREALEKL